MRKPVNGVTVMDEMPFEIVYKNWRNQRFPKNALMEVDGVLTVKNGVPAGYLKSKSIKNLLMIGNIVSTQPKFFCERSTYSGHSNPFCGSVYLIRSTLHSSQLCCDR